MAQPLHDNLWGFQMTAPLSSDLQEILDNYYAPIKLPEDNRQGLVTALELLIQSRERAARIDELDKLTHAEGVTHVMAEAISYKPIGHDMTHTWTTLTTPDNRIIVIAHSIYKDRYAELQNEKFQLLGKLHVQYESTPKQHKAVKE